MANLGQLFGQDKLRIMQLEDALAEAPTQPKRHYLLNEARIRPVLDLVGAAPEPLSAETIIKKAIKDLPKTGAYRALREMTDAGMLARTGKHGSYRYSLP